MQTSEALSSREAASVAPFEVNAPITNGTTFDLDVVPEVRSKRPIVSLDCTSGATSLVDD